MKQKYFPLLIALLFAIVIATPVFGQDEIPPDIPEPEEPERAPNAPSQPFEVTKQPLPDKPSSAGREVQPLPRDLVPIQTLGTSDRYSASDHGQEYVAVTHNRDGDIYVFIYSYGVWINRFLVSDGEGFSYAPDIAFEASTGLFIVTWHYLSETEGWNIQAVAIDPDNWGDEIVGDIMDVASSSWNESLPSVDCNFYDESCLVVYSLDNEVDFYRIDGRYMSMNASTGVDEASSSPNFAISDLNNEYRPFVAWSEPDQNYMVAYTWPYAGGGQRWPAYSVVMEYYDYGTPPVLKGTTYGIDSDLGNENEKYSNGIAYDNCSEQYVIMVGHDYNGDGSDYDVYASVIDGGGFSIWGTIPIAITYAQENSPDISYIKDAEFAMFNPTPDRLVITYYRDGYLDLDGIIATDLRGNCDPNNPWYSTDPAYLHSVVLNSGGDEYLTRDPSITGSNDGREFFVAFTYLDVGDYDIYGRYMTIVDKNFLPILLKY